MIARPLLLAEFASHFGVRSLGIPIAQTSQLQQRGMRGGALPFEYWACKSASTRFNRIAYTEFSTGQSRRLARLAEKRQTTRPPPLSHSRQARGKAHPARHAIFEKLSLTRRSRWNVFLFHLWLRHSPKLSVVTFKLLMSFTKRVADFIYQLLNYLHRNQIIQRRI